MVEAVEKDLMLSPCSYHDSFYLVQGVSFFPLYRYLKATWTGSFLVVLFFPPFSLFSTSLFFPLLSFFPFSLFSSSLFFPPYSLFYFSFSYFLLFVCK